MANKNIVRMAKTKAAQFSRRQDVVDRMNDVTRRWRDGGDFDELAIEMAVICDLDDDVNFERVIRKSFALVFSVKGCEFRLVSKPVFSHNRQDRHF